MHTIEGTKKFSTQRLKREHGQTIVFISRDLCTERRGERSVFEVYCLISSLNSLLPQSEAGKKEYSIEEAQEPLENARAIGH